MSCNLLIDWLNFNFLLFRIVYVRVCVWANGWGERESLPATLWDPLESFSLQTRHPPPTLCWFIIFPPLKFFKSDKSWWWLIQFIEEVDHPTTRRSSKTSPQTSSRLTTTLVDILMFKFQCWMAHTDSHRIPPSSNLPAKHMLLETITLPSILYFSSEFQPLLFLLPYLLKARW